LDQLRGAIIFSKLDLRSGYYQIRVRHLKDLKNVFEVLVQNKLFCKMSKCEFFQERISFFGHVIDKHGIAMDPTKVQAIVKWSRPKNVHEVLSFLGLACF
jgi:hypothetical protein